MDQITTQISIFKNKKIRKILHKNEWFFSVIDVIEALTDSSNPRNYWNMLKVRVEKEEGAQLYTNCVQLKLTDCASTETMFRIIQSIPSPKKDYELLTYEISKATFGVTPSEYKKLKGLKKENLRDHMDDFELLFNMLGEKSTTEIHKNEDSKGVEKLKQDAKVGGSIAGGARKQLEKKLGRSIIKKENFKKLK